MQYDYITGMFACADVYNFIGRRRVLLLKTIHIYIYVIYAWVNLIYVPVLKAWKYVC